MKKAKSTKRDDLGIRQQGDSPPRKTSKTSDSSTSVSRPETLKEVAESIKRSFRIGDGNRVKGYSELYTDDGIIPKLHIIISTADFAYDVLENDLNENFNIPLHAVIDVRKIHRTSDELNAPARQAMAGLLVAAREMDSIFRSESANKKSIGVLIHCNLGFERSIASVLSYLMGYQKYTFVEAAELINRALVKGRFGGHSYQFNKDILNNHIMGVEKVFGKYKNEDRSNMVLDAISMIKALPESKTVSDSTLTMIRIVVDKKDVKLVDGKTSKNLVECLTSKANTPVTEPPDPHEALAKEAAKGGVGQAEKEAEATVTMGQIRNKGKDEEDSSKAELPSEHTEAPKP